jgi:di/tripeptidase
VQRVGLEPRLIAVDAGLDANNFNQKGFPCVTLGAGTHNFHNTEEYVDLQEFEQCVHILMEIAQASAVRQPE